MRRIGRIGPVAAALLAASTAAPAPAQGDRVRACLSAGRTVMATPQLRVFRLEGVTHACWTPRRRVRRLPMGDAPRGTVAVAGRVAGWRSIECGAQDEGCETTVHVLDVRTGRVRFRSLLPDRARLASLVLTNRAWPAWIETARTGARVVTLDRQGARRVLDEGDVSRGSLATAGDRVYWTRGGEPRVARLPSG